MRTVPVFFATTEGQTRRIAEYLVEALRHRGLESVAIDIASPQAQHVDWTTVPGAVVGASLHIGRHQKQASRFVRAHHQYLNERPTAFFSVSLAAASKRPGELDEARTLARKFADATGWLPTRIACIAGRLAYTRYGWLTKFVVKRIAAKEGGPTDTTRDWEMTNWKDVDRLADEIAQDIRGQAVA